jgi:hypothetical protein
MEPVQLKSGDFLRVVGAQLLLYQLDDNGLPVGAPHR